MKNKFSTVTVLTAVEEIRAKGVKITEDSHMFLRLRDSEGFISDHTIMASVGDEFKGCRAQLRRYWDKATSAELILRSGNNDFTAVLQ